METIIHANYFTNGSNKIVGDIRMMWEDGNVSMRQYEKNLLRNRFMLELTKVM